MRLIAALSTLVSSILLTSCVQKGPNPVDPYESVNRKIYKFNMALDASVLKPSARVYKAVVPSPIRTGINNAFNNVLMLPTAANDLLQGDWRYAIKASWRFLINSTFGIVGFFDVADRGFGLPPHYNDLGLTFAKWGDKKSPYIVIPLLGPSTIRDGMSIPFDYMFTPYFYIPSGLVIYSLAGVRYVDIRTQLLETEPLLNEAFDKYSFIRDAYLQHRNYLITGEQADSDSSGYIDDEEGSGYVDEEPSPSQTTQSITSKSSRNQDAPHSAVPTRNSAQHG